MRKFDWAGVVLILIISILFSTDLFVHRGQPASFDETTHITNISLFYRGLAEGDFPVRWGDGFGNYGMPIPLIAQQTTSYLGALLTFLTHDVLLSYNIVILIGTVGSAILLYAFLRRYLRAEYALLGSMLFSLAPYRIMNVYIRGSLPEFFASIFLPAILLSLYYIVTKKSIWGCISLTLSVAALILTHPFTLLIYAFISVPYFMMLVFGSRHKLHDNIRVILSTAIGVGLSGYYVIPLFLEIKYFYYGLTNNHLVPNQYLQLQNFIDPRWYYFYESDIFTRGHFIKFDLLESCMLVAGFGYLIHRVTTKKPVPGYIYAAFVSTTALIGMTLHASTPLYEHIPILGGIQHQWRMLSALIFMPAIIMAWVVDSIGRRWIALVLIAVLCIVRFPELYGKNYTEYEQSHYARTIDNLHGTILNTVWTSNTTDYEPKTHKGDIFEGTGQIAKHTERNAMRIYRVNATSPVKMVDYTFYFPGWKVYVDGKETAIQFQDPLYRGVITYAVPPGTHTIVVRFEETKVRKLGTLISVISAIMGVLVAGWAILLKRRSR